MAHLGRADPRLSCPLLGEQPPRQRVPSAAVHDPTATLAVHRGNGFGAGFSPYRSTRLSR
jgi:hypothetical protein